MVSAIQERQSLIAAKDTKINELEERIKRPEESNAMSAGTHDPEDNAHTYAVLYQYTPNPFNGSTEIRYKLPQQNTNAEIMIFDLNGKKLSNLPIHSNEGKVIVDASDLAAGMYLYSLVLDGQEVATKKNGDQITFKLSQGAVSKRTI